MTSMEDQLEESSIKDEDDLMEYTFPAIRYRQGTGRVLYSFVVDGSLLREFTTISRVKRNQESAELLGYQRPEVKNHIKKIQDYLESENPIMPNSLVLALDPESLRFEGQKNNVDHDNGELGKLTITRRSAAGHLKPGWVVDGQQRTAAISQALKNPYSSLKNFPISVVGFEASDQRDQRTQFILVNSTKPLANSLIHEMLPSVDKEELPLDLQTKVLPYTLIEYLNFRDDSPLVGNIKTQTLNEGIAKDNSFATMIHASVEHGFLYIFWHEDRSKGECDMEMMYLVLSRFWEATKNVFSSSWDKKTSESRLLHGVGITALGNLMDEISFKLFSSSGLLDQRDTLYPYETFSAEDVISALPSIEDYEKELRLIEPFCAWDSGSWEFNDETRAWDALQNLSQDKRKLSKHLVHLYSRESRQSS